jgi:hypothetical protein
MHPMRKIMNITEGTKLPQKAVANVHEVMWLPKTTQQSKPSFPKSDYAPSQTHFDEPSNTHHSGSGRHDFEIESHGVAYHCCWFNLLQDKSKTQVEAIDLPIKPQIIDNNGGDPAAAARIQARQMIEYYLKST